MDFKQIVSFDTFLNMFHNYREDTNIIDRVQELEKDNAKMKAENTS